MLVGAIGNTLNLPYCIIIIIVIVEEVGLRLGVRRVKYRELVTSLWVEVLDRMVGISAP